MQNYFKDLKQNIWEDIEFKQLLNINIIKTKYIKILYIFQFKQYKEQVCKLMSIQSALFKFVQIRNYEIIPKSVLNV